MGGREEETCGGLEMWQINKDVGMGKRKETKGRVQG